MKQSRAPQIAALVLAAGQSRRMGDDNKLLLQIDGKPMISHVVEAALASQVSQTYVVTGHEADAVESVIAEVEAEVVRNPSFATGLSTSLAAGMRRILASGPFDGAIVLLGDMPGVTQDHLDRLIGSFDPARGRAICLPAFVGRRRNPVLFARRFFQEMTEIVGDVGARSLIENNEALVFEVAFDEQAIVDDIDTPDALASYRKTHTSLNRHSP